MTLIEELPVRPPTHGTVPPWGSSVEVCEGKTEPSASPARFPLLDALRGAAALAVLAFHVTQHGYARAVPSVQAVTSHLNAGVALFFALSGFVLFRPFLAAARHEGKPISLPAYFRRRIVRIVPAYWACLIVAGLLVGLPAVFSGRSPVFFGFLQIYSIHTANQGLDVAWSLCTEVSFYLLLPLVVVPLRVLCRRSRAWHWLVGGAISVLAVASVAFHAAIQGGPERALGISLLGTFYLFAVGMLLAVLTVRADESRAARRFTALLGRFGVLCWLVAGLVFVVIAEKVSANASGPVWPPYAVVAMLVLAPAVASQPSLAISKLLSWRPLVWLGVISYGVYLWHVPVLTALGRLPALQAGSAGTGLIVAGICVALSVVIAAISFYVLEAPLMAAARGARGSKTPRR